MSGAVPLPAAPVSLRSVLRRIPCGVHLAGEPALEVAVEVCWPEVFPGAPPALALVCLPGGGMNRRFYDLIPADGGDDFSFARQMTARGFVAILVDHLGVGDSSRPGDVFALTPEVLVAANARAVAVVLAALRDGSLSPELPALPAIRSIGVGHSMGAVLTILEQAEHCSHAALVILGFSVAGLPEFVSNEAKELLESNPTRLRRELTLLARRQFGAAPSTRGSAAAGSPDFFAGALADPRGVPAIKAARAPLLPVPAFLSMLPGNVAAECARVEVPVFIGVGEFDITGVAEAIPAAFTACPDVSLQVLPRTGHSHFLFAARQQLFDQLGGWLAAISG